MRCSISAKSAASTPPAPARIVMTAGRASHSPLSRVCTSRSPITFWMLVSSARASAAASSSPSSLASSTITSRSSRREAMLLIFASSDWRWLSSLVTFCAFVVSSQRSSSPACSLRLAISASSRSTPTTERMSPKVARRAAICPESSSSSMSPPAYRAPQKLPSQGLWSPWGLPTSIRPLVRQFLLEMGCVDGSRVDRVTTTPDPSFRWRSIALPALVPTLLFSIGEGAIIPIVPLFAGNLGATLAVAGLVGGILMIGELVGNIPSGWLVSRVGERPAMIGASLLSVIGLVICLLSPNAWALSVGVFLIGLATAVFALARHAFMTSFVPITHRARALSSLGGIFRFGYFIGPFITAGSIHLFGTVASAFWIHIVACLAAAAVLILVRDPTAAFGTLN